jgi:DNA polymerase IV
MTEDRRQRAMIHLDMDAFYPAVEVLDDPSLKGKPVIVGGCSGRGVVSSASYEARKFGVHSAQPMATAVRLCPHGIVLPVRMSRYKEISRRVFEVFHRFTPLVEALSIDEAFLDVTGSQCLFGPPEKMAWTIKQAVREETGLTVSAGVAPSKFVAKIASDLHKPDGLTVVPQDRVREFLDPLPIEKMWGVGEVTRQALARLNVRTFRDLSRMPLPLLEQRFGKWGGKMHLLATGIDDREVIPDHEVKSIGHEETFLEDILEEEKAKRELLSLADRVARRMRREGLKGKTLSLKVKYSDFHQITRSATLGKPTDDGLEIYRKVLSLLKKTEVGKRPVRLLGVALSRLHPALEGGQLDLFPQEAAQKRRSLQAALDHLHRKHGDGTILPGSLFSK